MGLLQYATAVVLLFVPLAAALYLTVTVTWTLVQRLVLRRRYPLPPEARRARHRVRRLVLSAPHTHRAQPARSAASGPARHESRGYLGSPPGAVCT